MDLEQAIDKLGTVFWDTYLFGNGATSSSWQNPNPIDMPEAKEDSYMFGDGAFTDGPSAAGAISRYQQKHGSDGEIKLIISNTNNVADNLNNILGYFSTTWNQDVAPGDFIWPMGVGKGPQSNPQQSKQIFQEYMDEDSLNAKLEGINDGTNITMATISATTMNNGAYGYAHYFTTITVDALETSG